MCVHVCVCVCVCACVCVSAFVARAQTVLPAATDAEVNEILEKRCVVDVDPLDDIDPDVLEALFPSEDLKVVEDLGSVVF